MENNFLIVGLGNPGHEYEGTRHNVGFDVVNLLAKKLDVKFNTNKFDGTFFTYQKNNCKYYICKPQTFMNLSGNFVQEIKKFYKISINNIIIIYDDIDIEVGKIKIKNSGSSGGQNGIKNIIQLLGTKEVKRIRIGIGKPKYDMVKHVLGRFEINELAIVKSAINHASDALIDFINGQSFEKIMSLYNK